MQVGEEFSGAKSESLEESIRRQSLNYFRSYHRAKLDELRMFLENEGWELCPVKPTFSILMLQVFVCSFLYCHYLMRLLSDTLRPTPLPWLPVLTYIEPPGLRRKAAVDGLVAIEPPALRRKSSSGLTGGQSNCALCMAPK